MQSHLFPLSVTNSRWISDYCDDTLRNSWKQKRIEDMLISAQNVWNQYMIFLWDVFSINFLKIPYAFYILGLFFSALIPGCLSSALLTFRDWQLFAVGSCLVHCISLSSVPGLNSLSSVWPSQKLLLTKINKVLVSLQLLPHLPLKTDSHELMHRFLSGSF